MKIIGDTQIVRTAQMVDDVKDVPPMFEWEIPVAYNVEEIYKGTEEPDDPSECTINERVKVLEDIGPFRMGDLLVLTADEQEELQQEVLQEQL